MPKANQHLPLPPAEPLNYWIGVYWKLGFNDKAIASHIMDHFDKSQYGIGYKSVQRRRNELGLLGTRQLGKQLTAEQLMPLYEEIRRRYPAMGARGMVTQLRLHYDLKVPEKQLLDLFNVVEPQAVIHRKHKRFKRKTFYCAGVMDILAIDQHDKWKRFGLYLHVAIDPFTGRISWLKIWWTNRNPILITSYYIEAARQLQGIPLVTQSDPGSENNGIANCHTSIRHRLDPTLQGTLQHKWITGNGKNVKPEAVWSDLRRHWTVGFETLLDWGVAHGFYDINNGLAVEQLIFRWLAIPWLQAELDVWRTTRNCSKKRSDKHKILPQAIPDVIHSKPERYGHRSFMIGVNDQILDDAAQKWACPEHPVFELTPASFHECAQAAYESLGSPPVARETFWTVYCQLKQALEAQQLPSELHSQWQSNYNDGFEAIVGLMEGQKDFQMEDPIINGALGEPWQYRQVHVESVESEFNLDRTEQPEYEEVLANFSGDDTDDEGLEISGQCADSPGYEFSGDEYE
ncbi:hypothetical protein C8J56DRAFT_1114407 [Mycena floridula]|nr:hypothetical protein C8J56DRAFT_1114407 [Mycena floridula]